MSESLDEAAEEIREAADNALSNVAEGELEKSEDAYDNEKTVLGTPWKPLAPETIRKKGHDTILVEEGDMRDSGYVNDHNNELVVDVGYSDEKVAFHEFGTEDIPARPILEPMRIDLKEGTMLNSMAASMRRDL